MSPPSTITARSLPTGLKPAKVLSERGIYDWFKPRIDDGLCEMCHGINIERLAAFGGYKHATDRETLRGSAKNCRMCKLIEKQASYAKIYQAYGQIYLLIIPPPTVGQWTTVVRSATKSGVHLGALHLGAVYGDIATIKFNDILFFTQEGDPAVDYGVLNMRVLSSTTSPRSFEVAKQWLEECTVKHKCLDVAPVFVNEDGSPQKPKRVIDVASFGPSHDVRLVDTEDLDPVYIALSYCWGSRVHPQFTTTTGTLEARMSRIIFDELPLTISHAVQITRKLGIPYLWVDAICIIQDSPEDWQHEAAKMAGIYSRAVLTLAADLGDHSHSGMFNTASKTQYLVLGDMLTLDSLLGDGRPSKLFIDPHPGVTSAFGLTRDCASATRAWVLQERILAPRVLHFTRDQLIWECRAASWGEDNLPIDSQWYQASPRITNTFGIDLREKLADNQILDAWYHVLIRHDYSRRALTNPGDKLIALAGLARLVGHYLKSRYIAGLWGRQLAWGLGWRRYGPVSPKVPYRCPTFSWAAIDTEVVWTLGAEVKNYLQILDCNMKFKGEDPFGAVIDGSLKVRGWVGSGSIWPIKYFSPGVFDSSQPPSIYNPEATLTKATSGVELGYAYMDQEAKMKSVDFIVTTERTSELIHLLILRQWQEIGGVAFYTRIGTADVETRRRDDLFKGLKLLTIEIR
ncbi:heterokaryon incompatibility protein-domain-containing protein [Rhexocercosporidium sp. MPI-PUGE-AT-0058]|nr:heterokaryon incompatibility protein-domain-containing protein [Rhexocercosporidium sp. MPI-PUGE-AT-0058]